MPHFTLAIGPFGAVVDAFIAVSPQRAEALQRAGQSVPNAVRVRALIDTGASCSCVDPKVLESLGIQPTGREKVHTASTAEQKPHETNQYDIGLAIPNGIQPPLMVPNLPVIEAALEHLGYKAIVGRDVLASCILVYDGSGYFALAY